MALPPIPRHPEPHTYTWTKLELEEIEAYGKKCFEAALAQPAQPAENAAAKHWHDLYVKVCGKAKDDVARYGTEIAALEGQTVAEYQYQNTVTGRWEPFACVEDYESRAQMNIYPTRKLYIAAGAREAQPTLEAKRQPMTEAEALAVLNDFEIDSPIEAARAIEKHHGIEEPK